MADDKENQPPVEAEDITALTHPIRAHVFTSTKEWADATPDLYHDRHYINNLWDTTPQNFKKPSESELINSAPAITNNYAQELQSQRTGIWHLSDTKGVEYNPNMDLTYQGGPERSLMSNGSTVHYAYPYDLMTDKVFLAEQAKAQGAIFDARNSAGYGDNLAQIFNNLHSSNPADNSHLAPLMHKTLAGVQNYIDTQWSQYPLPSSTDGKYYTQAQTLPYVSMDADKKNIIIMQPGSSPGVQPVSPPEMGYIAVFRIQGLDDKGRIQLGEPVTAVSAGAEKPEKIFDKARSAINRDNQRQYINTLEQKTIQNETLIDGTYADKTLAINVDPFFADDIAQVVSNAPLKGIIDAAASEIRKVGIRLSDHLNDGRLKNAISWAQKYDIASYCVYVTPDQQTAAVVDQSSILVEKITVDDNGVITPVKTLGVYAENPSVADVISSAGTVLHAHIGAKLTDSAVIQQGNERIDALNATAPYRQAQSKER